MVFRFVILFFIVLFFSGGASGSLVNSVLSDNYLSGASNLSPFQSFIQSQLSRKLLINEQPFDIDQENNLLDLLYINIDINMEYSFNKIFSQLNSDFFSKSAFFFLFRYERPVYSGEENIKQLCWIEVVCFKNSMTGVRGSLFKSDDFLVELSMYAKLPFSKLFIKRSFLVGVGSSLKTVYSIPSTGSWKLSFISEHSFGLDAYIYQTANIKGTSYNQPVEIWNQIGFQLFHIKYKWFPQLFVYGDYQLFINFNGVFYHHISLSNFLSWPVSKKIQVLLGLSWGDRMLDQYNVKSAGDAEVFNINKIFIHFGGGYTF